MVTFYRKAQINGQTAPASNTVEPNRNTHSGRWNDTQYFSGISPEDDLPYITVRPKGARNGNGKKVLRMRSSWD